MMKILAIDTTLAACSVAVLNTETGTHWRESAPMQRGHAEALMPMIGAVMAASRLTFAELDRIAVTVGPGTFTGLRVGLAAVRGLGLAAAKPVVGVGTLEAHAHGFLADKGAPGASAHLAIALDARKGEIYLQLFTGGGSPACAPCALPTEAAASRLPAGPLTIAGSGADLLASAASGRRDLATAILPPGPDPLAVARLAAARPLPDGSPSPLYLRPPDAKPQSRPAFVREAAP